MALAHITLATRDAKRSAAFFHEVMGWTPIGRPTNNATPTSWLQIAPGQELHMVEVPDFEPSPFEREYGRHVAVSLPRSAFAGVKDRLAARDRADRARARRPRSPGSSSATPMATSSR